MPSGYVPATSIFDGTLRSCPPFPSSCLPVPPSVLASGGARLQTAGMRSRSWAVRAAIGAALGVIEAGCSQPGDWATASAAAADAFDEEQQAAAAKNPEGVAFTVRLLSPTRVFHQGERIPIELSFTSRIPGRYRLDRAAYDRSGRLAMATYKVAPSSGVTDPLAEYFADGIFIGGGMRSIPELGQEPETLVFDLNEWLRFDEPGPYRLYVQSSRLQREADADDLALEHDTVTSGVLALSILPGDPAWSAAALGDATRAYEAADDPRDASAREEAARALRFLGTADAAREMAARFTNGGADFDLMFGLIGSPEREAAAAALEAQLDAPGFPVIMSFLDVTARLRARLDAPAALGRRPADPVAAVFWEAAAVEARAARVAADARVVDRLVGRLDGKRGAARATSVGTLLEMEWRRPMAGGDAGAPAWYPRVAALVPEVFGDLPRETQVALLDRRWSKVRSPAMLPLIQRLLADAGTAEELRGVALRRLYQLAPEEGRERILAAIAAPGPPLGTQAFETLAVLPDASLPEFDDALAARFEGCIGALCNENPALSARLLVRYATAAVAGRVWAAWKSRREVAYDVTGAVMAFLGRVDPERADELAQGELARARAAGPDRVPGMDELDRAAEFGMAPPIERALLDALDDRDPRVAATAAGALARSGSAAVEPRLWRRLERWNAAWRDRSKDLRRKRFFDDSPNQYEADLEGALWRAIATGSAWLTDAAGLARLDALVLTKSEKQQLAYMRGNRAADPIAIHLSRYDDGTLSATVAQYRFDSVEALEAKLALFPRGARFVCGPHSALPADLLRIEAFLAARGMRLER